MTLIRKLLKEYEEVLGVERCKIILYYSGIEKLNKLNEGVDDFDWSDIELSPEMLPKRIDRQINSNIPSFVKDGMILPKYIDDEILLLIKYNEKLALDYTVIKVKKL